MKLLDLAGRRFGRLLVIEQAGVKGTSKQWRCVCDCGNEKVAVSRNLNTGRTASCGCLVVDTNRSFRLGKPATNRTHGATQNKSRTPEYSCWLSLRQRCTDPNVIEYPLYGGRGIKVCDRWKDSFQNFLSDMGEKPSKNHSIDRVDVNGNYEPENCRWASWLDQQNNKNSNRLVFVGSGVLTATELARKSGIATRTLFNRLKKFEAGEITENELTSTHKWRAKILPNGETIEQAANRLGLSVAGMGLRVKKAEKSIISWDSALAGQSKRKTAKL